MAVSPATYEQVALEDDDATWEYVCGRLREKPAMIQAHNDVAFTSPTTWRRNWTARCSRYAATGRLQTHARNAYVADVAVVPVEASRVHAGTGRLENYTGPLPFVAEVWSPSTGGYDIATKIPDYIERGDEVIWRGHPYEKSVRAWTRETDGSYCETEHSGGRAPIASLAGVSIELDVLFS